PVAMAAASPRRSLPTISSCGCRMPAPAESRKSISCSSIACATRSTRSVVSRRAPTPGREMKKQACVRAALVAATIGLSAGLAGCFTAAATGIVMGGLAAVDRRTIGAQTEDQGIEIKAYEALRANKLQGGGISVTSFNRRVLLTGQVENESVKERAG